MKTPLKIAMVVPPWFEIPPVGYGGIEWICYWLAEGLVARGHEVTVVGAGRKRTSARFHATFDEPPTAKLGEAVIELTHVGRASEILSAGKFDVVHDHTLSGPLLGFGRKAPTVVTAHGPLIPEMIDYYRVLASRVFFVAISDSQRQGAVDLPWVGTVHNAIPVDEYPFCKVKEDFVLFLGRMNVDKGPHLAIDAARAAGYPIVVAAKCNEAAEREFLHEEITPRLGPGVNWIGEANTNRKKDLLSRARCLVFPIQWEEPFGIVMLEAMAAGTPVVALRRGSVMEVVVDGVTGFICDHPDELPDAIKAAGSLDPQACRDHAMGFDLRHMVSGYERVYRKAMARSSASQAGGLAAS
jgi:glycosyltransferase involved in cell wall biosynthesis